MISSCARATLWISVATIVLLTFAWPFAISPEPDQAIFKVFAIPALFVFLVSMTILLVQRARR